MISSRRRSINPLLLAVAAWPRTLRGQPFTRAEIECLVCVYVAQMESNTFPTIRLVMDRLGYSIRNTAGVHMTRLVENGLLEIVPGDMYNVTAAGEYYIRGLVTTLSRIANSSKLSRWESSSKSPLRSRYKRKSTRSCA